MKLNIQISLLLSSFIFGIMFSLLVNIFFKLINYQKIYLKIIYNIIISLLYFYIILKINNGIIHYYSIIAIILGYLFVDIRLKKWYTFYGDNMKKNKRFKRRIVLTVPITLTIIVFSLITCVTELIKINNLMVQEKELKAELKDLILTSEQLDIEITKLNDPDYIARYAREKYLYSKDDEIVVIIESAEQLQEVDNKINKNYLFVGIIGCMVIILFIFVFIFTKKNRKKELIN